MINVITRDTHQKIYLQLYTIFKKKIEDGEWQVNYKIPSEKELCKMYNASRTSIRAAIGELVREGYLLRIPGKGTFVLKKSIDEGIIMTTFYKEIWLEKDLSFSSQILVKTTIMPIENLHKILNISLSTHLIFIKRLWSINNVPSVLQEIYIPYFVCPHLLEEDLKDFLILEFIEKNSAIKITKAEINIDLDEPSPSIRQDLKLNNKEKVLLIHTILYSGPSPVIYSKTYKKKDEYKLSFKLERKSL